MIRLVAFHIFPNVDVPEQIRRRIETRMDVTTAQNLGNLFATHGQDAMATSEYNMYLSDICRFSTRPDGFEKPIINISGDQDTIVNYNSRARIYNFTAELICREPADMSLIEYSYVVSGYTSEAEPSISGLLPDDLVMYINDIHGIQTVYERMPGGGLGNPRQKSVDNYLLANVLSSYGNILGTSEYLVNPATIASTGVMINSLELGDNESLDNAHFTPTIGSNLSGAQIYSSNITRPENLMSTVVASYVNHENNVTSDQDDITNMIFNTPHTSISQYVTSARLVCSFSSHEFIRALTAGLRGNVNNAERKSAQLESSARFTLGDFMAAIANKHDLTSQIAEGLSHARRSLAQLETQENTDNWVGANGYSTRGSIVAYDIAMRLGSVMSGNLIGKVQFAYDTVEANAVTKPRMHIFNDSVGSVSRSNISLAFAQRFSKMLEAMMFQATEYSRLPCTVVVKAVLGVATRIEVKLDGGSWEYYTFASFLSSRLHIGQTNDRQYINNLGKDAAGIYKAVSEGFNEFNRVSNIANIGSYTPTTLGGGTVLDNLLATDNSNLNFTLDI